MMRELPAHVFNGWRAFAAENPFGPRAWDHRIAHVLAVIVHALTGKPQRPADYLIEWTGSQSEPPRQDWREMKAVFDRWTNAHNRKD